MSVAALEPPQTTEQVGPIAPASRARVKPASYPVALLLVLGIIIGAEVIGEAAVPVLRAGNPSSGTLVLLGVGGAALLALLVLNARWLWSTVGNLKFALALITVWALSSVLGTLVVQRFPNQTDTGYAKAFTNATGDFFYNATHFFNGVVVHPDAGVQAWLAEQERLYGKQQADETRLEWFRGEAGRLKQMEIEQYTADHAELLRNLLSIVSAVRLPEAFQISVWFKALLGLLCFALISVVIQRWRGEWRQIGWAMAHFGMVIFIVGASLRATQKVDGFLPMHVGETSDFYFRNVTEAKVATPLDFQLTLNRFKTEYPKQLLVSLMSSDTDGASKNFRVAPGWEHPFLQDQLLVHFDRERADQQVRVLHRDVPGGPPDPAAHVQMRADWLPRQAQDAGLRSRESTIVPPDNAYHLQYARAADAQQLKELVSADPGAGSSGSLATGSGRLAGDTGPGDIFPGQTWTLPGPAPMQLRALGVYPDYARRAEPGAEHLPAREPALRGELFQNDASLGEIWIFADRTELPPGVTLGTQLYLEYDWFNSAAPLHYRIVDVQGGAPVLATWRDGVPAGTQPLPPGAEVRLGEDGADALKLVAICESYAPAWKIEDADTTGMSKADVYYASLPSVVELTLTGKAVEWLARDPLGIGRRFPTLGLVEPAAFDAGEGMATPTPDGKGLRVRLLCDSRELATFPNELLGYIMGQAGEPLPFRLTWFTNERGAPLRFTSDVTLSKDGRELARALVEPNRPMYLAGYQFSQADFHADEPTYSGFGVVRDPSVHIVYYGMAVLVSGVILLFYLYPLFAGRKARRSAS